MTQQTCGALGAAQVGSKRVDFLNEKPVLESCGFGD
jgi:hypothetical protein